MMLAALAWLVGSGPALASGPEIWSALYNARLIESADRDQRAASDVYEAVLEHLEAEDPLRGELLYALGRARLDAGDRAGARAALVQAASPNNPPQAREPAEALLARLELDERQVLALPYLTGFDDGLGAFVRGWPRGQREDLGTAQPAGADGGALAFHVEVRAGEDDFLRVELGPGAAGVERLRLRLRADRLPAQLRLLVEDLQGQRWTAPVFAVPVATWVDVDLSLADFAPAEAPAALRRPDPGQLRAIELRDLSAYLSAERGENTLFIDRFDLR